MARIMTLNTTSGTIALTTEASDRTRSQCEAEIGVIPPLLCAQHPIGSSSLLVKVLSENACLGSASPCSRSWEPSITTGQEGLRHTCTSA
eukprot:2570024-Amphidinium_carterae.1